MTLRDDIEALRKRLAKAESDRAEGPFTQCTMVAAPSDAERELMASLAIEFDAGAYQFGNFRYDRLADAVNYARFADGVINRTG